MLWFKENEFEWTQIIERDLIAKARGDTSKLTIARSRRHIQHWLAGTTDQLTSEKVNTYKVIPFQNLSSPKHVLNEPIFILLEGDGNVVTATCYDACGLFGFGDTEQEAIADLCNVLMHCYEDLVAEEDNNLGPEPRRIKSYLTKIMSKKNAA